MGDIKKPPARHPAERASRETQNLFPGGATYAAELVSHVVDVTLR
jgi:hypothetical protein